MAEGCQTASERPYFNRRSSLIKKGVVRLGHMQEAHRNLNFRRSCGACLQAGTLDQSICSSAAADECYSPWSWVGTQAL